ncbi:MAG: transporter substrate-binding domain-containing protein [Atopobiaceae bacterium]|nr:transporter substrate-binding domain-containing protein [Atopobiaceae bacterium]
MKRRIWTAVMSCLLGTAILISGCSFYPDLPTVGEVRERIEQATSPKITPPALNQEGKLVVGLKTTTSLPFQNIDDISQQASGLDIDLAAAIGDQLGLKLEFVSVSGFDDAQDKGCDIMMSARKDEGKGFTLIGQYAETSSALFHRGSSTDIVDVSTLNARSIGVQASSVSQRILENAKLNCVQKEFPTLNQAFEAMNSGSVDYVLCDSYQGAYLAASYGNISFCGAFVRPQPIGIAIDSDNASLQMAVQQALDTVSTNGQFRIVRRRWVGSLPQLSVASLVTGLTVDLSAVSAGDSTSEIAQGTNVSGAGSNAVTNISQSSDPPIAGTYSSEYPGSYSNNYSTTYSADEDDGDGVAATNTSAIAYNDDEEDEPVYANTYSNNAEYDDEDE